MKSQKSPASALARRLRQLREHHWENTPLTQRDLARVFGGSVPLISSWESTRSPTVPPAERLLAYAGFFASERSVVSRPYKLIDDSELTADEQNLRDELTDELLAARAEAVQHLDAVAGDRAAAPGTEDALGGLWHFGDGKPITIVCAERPAEQVHAPAHPDDRDLAYADLYSFADLDALMELYGHIRAANPTVKVKYRKANDLEPDDYTTHLVVLGGIDWNVMTRELLNRVELPVTQMSKHQLHAEYQVREADGTTRSFEPEWAGDKLVVDIGHFLRTSNPFNQLRTVTICNGIATSAVLGTVRALTDERFRDRNARYLQDTFAGCGTYSVLTKVQIVDGAVLTPDWTDPDTRLHATSGS